MDIPKLKLPPKSFTIDDCYPSAKRKGTLSRIVMDTITEQNKRLKLPQKGSDSEYQWTVKACKAINQSFQQTRELIDARVQDYLLAHDGKADSWPDCTDLDYINWDNFNGIVEFDYFGDEYEVVKTNSLSLIHRKSENFVYRNTFEAPDSPEYAEIKKEEEKLREDSSGKRDIGDVGMLLAFALLTLLGGFACFAFIAEIVNGGFVEHTLRPLLAEWAAKPGIGWLQVVLEKFFSFLLIPADKLSSGTAADLLGLVFSVAVAFVFTGFCAMVVMGSFIQRSAWKKYKKLKKSKRYQEAVANNEAYRKLAQALSDEWHKAWFEWAKAQKKCVGQTYMDRFMEKNRAEERSEKEREIQELAENSLGLRIPDGMDVVQWWNIYDKKTDALLPEYAENGEKDFEELPSKVRAEIFRRAAREMVEEGRAEYID